MLNRIRSKNKLVFYFDSSILLNFDCRIIFFVVKIRLLKQHKYNQTPFVRKAKLVSTHGRWKFIQSRTRKQIERSTPSRAGILKSFPGDTKKDFTMGSRIRKPTTRDRKMIVARSKESIALSVRTALGLISPYGGAILESYLTHFFFYRFLREQ